MSRLGCKLSDRCDSSDCDYCHFNPDACTQDFFEWNGKDEEPTEEEKQDAMC